MNIIQSPSPNFYSRDGQKADTLVIHITDGAHPGDLNWLTNPASQVSSHFLIAPGGPIHQLIQLQYAAWHAGRIDAPVAPLKKNSFGFYINPNKYTVGIEVSLIPPALMDEWQLKSLHWLIKSHLKPLLNLSLDRQHIWGHWEVFSKKTCPATINVDDLVRDLTLPPLSQGKEIKVIVDGEVLWSHQCPPTQ